MDLFVSIVKCLSGKEFIVYFKEERAYFKKEQAFSIWKNCYLACDSDTLYIKRQANNKNSYL